MVSEKMILAFKLKFHDKASDELDYDTRLRVSMEAALSTDAEPVAQLLRINEMMDTGDDGGSPILPDFEKGWSVEAKVEACLHLLEKRRDVIEGFTVEENWRDDPDQDERWNAGLDFAMTQLCKVLKVDPKSISWDCATETLEGDAQSQIHKVLAAAPPSPAVAVKAVIDLIREYGNDALPDSEYRLACNDLIEAFTQPRHAALSAQVQDVAVKSFIVDYVYSDNEVKTRTFAYETEQPQAEAFCQEVKAKGGSVNIRIAAAPAAKHGDK